MDFSSEEMATTFSPMSIEQSVEFIENCYKTITETASIDPIRYIKDKVVLEVGHGENVGLALKFIVAGANRVFCVDKFQSIHDRSKEKSIYKSLREKCSAHERKCFDHAIKISDEGTSINDNCISIRYGTDLKDIHSLFSAESIDIIYSNAVLEHVSDPVLSFVSMDKLLKPGGLMVHVVDFKDHGLFTSHALHPLTFLTIPGFLYRLMTSHSGQPNRYLINYYRDIMNTLKYDFKILVMQVVNTLEQVSGNTNALAPNMRKDLNTGIIALKCNRESLDMGYDYTEANLRLLNEIRPHLRKDFKNLSNEDLLTSSIILVGRKPL